MTASTDMIVSAMLRTFIAGAVSIAGGSGVVSRSARASGFFDPEVSFFAAGAGSGTAAEPPLGACLVTFGFCHLFVARRGPAAPVSTCVSVSVTIFAAPQARRACAIPGCRTVQPEPLSATGRRLARGCTLAS